MVIYYHHALWILEHEGERERGLVPMGGWGRVEIQVVEMGVGSANGVD